MPCARAPVLTPSCVRVIGIAGCAGVPGTNDAAADTTERRRPAVPIGWGRVPGHEVAFPDRLPFLLTAEVQTPPCLPRSPLHSCQSEAVLQSPIQQHVPNGCTSLLPTAYLS